jgi:hypothetical protein
MAIMMRLRRSFTRFFGNSARGALQEKAELVVLEHAARHLLGIAKIDGGAGRSRGPEGETGELQAGGCLLRALADEIEGEIAHGGVVLVLQHLEPVHDGPHGRDDVVAHAGAEERGKIEGVEGDGGHAVSGEGGVPRVGRGSLRPLIGRCRAPEGSDGNDPR